jgi:CheY-like chemotaxis protein
MAALSKTTNDTLPASPLEHRRPDAKPLVLVAEDHEDTRFMLSYLLDLRGYQVVEAADGEEAVLLAGRLCPDLILMDMSLPRLDGLAAMLRIRQLDALHYVPVVFLSGHAQPDIRAAALAKGGNEFLVKPLKLSELEIAIERQLGEDCASRAGQQSQERKDNYHEGF